MISVSSSWAIRRLRRPALWAWHSTDDKEFDAIENLGDVEGIVPMDVVAGGPGFVAVGQDQDRGVAWISNDGVIWTRIDREGLPTGACAGLFEVDATDDAVVALGCSGAGEYSAYRSTDGISWESYQFPGDTVFIHGVAGESGFADIMTNALVDTPFGYVGTGLFGAGGEELEADPVGTKGFVIHSYDGQQWTAMLLEDAPPFTELTATDDAIYGAYFGYGTWKWTSST